jgi:hypothetical protein
LSNGIGGVVAVYEGNMTRKGVSSARSTGTMTSNIGGSGIWYAVTAP